MLYTFFSCLYPHRDLNSMTCAHPTNETTFPCRRPRDCNPRAALSLGNHSIHFKSFAPDWSNPGPNTKAGDPMLNDHKYSPLQRVMLWPNLDRESKGDEKLPGKNVYKSEWWRTVRDQFLHVASDEKHLVKILCQMESPAAMSHKKKRTQGAFQNDQWHWWMRIIFQKRKTMFLFGFDLASLPHRWWISSGSSTPHSSLKVTLWMHCF